MYKMDKKDYKTTYVPIIIFAYCRKDELIELWNSLKANKEFSKSPIYIFSDGPKNTPKSVEGVNAVREWLNSEEVIAFSNDVHVCMREKNIGLANSVIQGVSEIIQKYGRVIVLEDDLIVSSKFLKFMNEALDYYYEDDQIGSIAAYTPHLKSVSNYSHDMYITRKADCWGWATWEETWSKIDWDVSDYQEYLKSFRRRFAFESLQSGIDGMLRQQMNHQIDSWAVRWIYNMQKEKLLTVYPTNSLVRNIGFGTMSTHCKREEIGVYDVDIWQSDIQLEHIEINRTIEHENAIIDVSKRNIIKRKVGIVADTFLNICRGAKKCKK